MFLDCVCYCGLLDISENNSCCPFSTLVIYKFPNILLPQTWREIWMRKLCQPFELLYTNMLPTQVTNGCKLMVLQCQKAFCKIYGLIHIGCLLNSNKGPISATLPEDLYGTAAVCRPLELVSQGGGDI